MKNFTLILFCLLNFLIISKCWSSEVSAEGSNGGKITLINKNEEIAHYTFEISGFDPGEKLKTICKSRHEVVRGEFIFPSSGNQTVMVLAAVTGYCCGDASFTVIGEKKG